MELENKIFEIVRKEPGITVEELCERLKDHRKYDICKTLEEMEKKREIVLVPIKGKFDPYRPFWTLSVTFTRGMAGYRIIAKSGW